MASPTLYSDGGREREAIEGLDLLSSKVDALADNVMQKRYHHKFGNFITDIDSVVSIITPEGLDAQLIFMVGFRQPRNYERQLQVELHKFFNDEPHVDILMLLELTLSSLNGQLDTGYVGAGAVNLLQTYDYRKLEVAKIYKTYGYRGVVLVLKYYVDFWYKI